MTKNEVYERVKTEHPDWTDEQAWTQVSVIINAEDVIQETPNIKPNDNELISLIFRKAEEWLHENLPKIWEKMKEWLRGFIENITEWIKNHGWDFLTSLFTDSDYDYDY